MTREASSIVMLLAFAAGLCCIGYRLSFICLGRRSGRGSMGHQVWDGKETHSLRSMGESRMRHGYEG